MIGGIILNIVGGIIRYLFWNFFRLILDKKLYTYSEYLYGPKVKTDAYFDTIGHEFNNKIIALVVFGIIISLTV